MVAITVILAAVIGTFVLGLGDQVQETSPNAQWSWEQTDVSGDANIGTGTYQAEVRHDGGQNVDPSSLSLQVESDNSVTTYDPTVSGNWDGLDSDGDIVAGSSFKTVEKNPDNDDTTADGVALDSGDTVRILWQSNEGGTSSTLTEFELN